MRCEFDDPFRPYDPCPDSAVFLIKWLPITSATTRWMWDAPEPACAGHAEIARIKAHTVMTLDGEALPRLQQAPTPGVWKRCINGHQAVGWRSETEPCFVCGSDGTVGSVYSLSAKDYYGIPEMVSVSAGA